MKITRFSAGATCLGAVRLLPIDMGFDARATGQAIRLPLPEADAILGEDGPSDQTGVGYEQDGVPYLMHGRRDEIFGVLVRAGYRVVCFCPTGVASSNAT